MRQIFEVIDDVHEISIRVMPDNLGQVCFEVEMWGGDKRQHERLVVEPDEAISFTRAIHLCARRARKAGGNA